MFLALLLASQMTAAAGAPLDSTTTLATYLTAGPHQAPPDLLRYRFTCDYIYGDVRGAVGRRERIAGDYVRAVARDESHWESVTRAKADGLDNPYAVAVADTLLDHIRYRTSDRQSVLQPAFFAQLPPTAIQERNLVWDIAMFEGFASEHNARVRYGVPMHAPSGDVGLAGAGHFKNRDIVLQWTGVGMEGGRECALVTYQAFFNTLDVTAPGMHLQGRSHYWGTIWVARDDGQIIRATLYEDVLGQLETGANPAGQVVSIFRDAALVRSNTPR